MVNFPFFRHNPQGFTEYIEMPNPDRGFEVEAFNILLLYGMSAIQAKAVLAHELMHVWLADNGIIDIDDALCEGSCDYASYMFLKDVGSAQSNYIIRIMREDLDPVYGRGFRDVERYVGTNGVAAWLHMLHEEARRAPSSYAIQSD
ncbi:MAG: protein DA1 [Candidatus Krumholzibacteria bacterium]|nr:protein DA1 [Candidatus Krumholzibacteria bacterium]